MIYAFGDSFTAGLGVDNKWEQSQLGDRPDWNIMSEEKKDIQRSIVEKFRNKNSYATRFANKINQRNIFPEIIGKNNYRCHYNHLKMTDKTYKHQPLKVYQQRLTQLA